MLHRGLTDILIRAIILQQDDWILMMADTAKVFYYLGTYYHSPDLGRVLHVHVRRVSYEVGCLLLLLVCGGVGAQDGACMKVVCVCVVCRI
jgi:hypothetical protein